MSADVVARVREQARGKRGRNKLTGRLNRAELEHMYHVEKLSQWDIAFRFQVTQGAVFYWMRKWNIQSRTHDDALIQFGKSGRFTGAKNPKWNGGRHIGPGGYVMLRNPTHPRADKRGYVREHVAVWMLANGELPRGWHVHHKNGIKTDNRPENLEAMAHERHSRVIPRMLSRIAELEEEVRLLKEKS